MDIEGVAAKDPSAIKTFPVPLEEGVSDSLATEIAVPWDSLKMPFQKLPNHQSLYKCFIERDCTQVEINPYLKLQTTKFWPWMPN